ncbi:methyltransferase domain-containing protein [Thermodesulfobacteriota bacterium]
MNKISLSSHNWLISKINNECLRLNISDINGRVIDFGCGLAPYKADILEAADEYIGVDWDRNTKKKGRVDVIANLIQPLPFEDEFADTIVSFQVLEHLPEPVPFLRECYRILKPGGYILLTVPFMWHLHEEPHDYYRFTRFGLKYLLTSNGFEDIVIRATTGFWQVFVLKFNYHSVRFAGGVFRYFWIPLWWFLQTIAPVLDKIDKNDKETASYVVIARRGNN